MCLCTKNKDGRISDKPIKCYKVYKKRPDGGMESYFRADVINVKEGDEVVAQGEAKFREGLYKRHFELGEGFIHAVEEKWMTLLISEVTIEQINLILNKLYIKDKDIIRNIDSCLGKIIMHLMDLHLCEMEIPAGERYWVGLTYPGFMTKRDICARKMIFKKEFEIDKKSELLNMIWEECSDYCTNNTNKMMRELIEKYKEKGE